MPAHNFLPVILVSAAALVDGQGRVLLAQRGQGRSMAGLWEFPGGKVQPGETPEQALVRELDEELGLAIDVKNLKPAGFASHSYSDFHLLMPLFLCREWTGTPVAREHSALKWVKPDDMSQFPMPEADIPLVATLRTIL